MAVHARTLPGTELEPGAGVYNAKIGMWVFLASEVLFFTGLIGSYIILRWGAAGGWPTPGEVLPVDITAVNTFVLICSSVTIVKAFAAVERGHQRATWIWLLATLVLGSIFLSVQVYEYSDLMGKGFMPTCGEELAATVTNCNMVASTFYLTTGFHGLHVFLGLVCVAFTTVKAYLGGYSKENFRGVEVLGLYWHFVDLVWIILFTIVYLI